nr:HesA/MoeB/ThiF family protein [Candidatus Njordarchaeum guaymaensis]
MSLSKDELERYSRQIALRGFGVEGQLKVRSARVCVMGLGGLGSVSSLQLAGIGVGYLRIVDRDVVDLTNLQRQLMYDVSSMGYPKVEVAAKKLQNLNPRVKVDPIATSVSEDNADYLVKGMDVVVDAFDRFSPRFAVNKACVKHKIPYVFGGAIETCGNATTIVPGETPCLECLFRNADDATLPTCEMVGVIPPIINIIASIQVNETLEIILKGKPLLANKILYCDLTSPSFDIFNVTRRKDCPVCGSPPAKAQRVSPEREKILEMKEDSVTELCGKESFMITPREQVSMNMKETGKILSQKYRIKIAADYGVTLEISDKVSVSLMKGGNMLIKGVKNSDEAKRVHDEIIRLLKQTP